MKFFLRIVVAFFILVNFSIALLKSPLEAANISRSVLYSGNVILFIVTLMAFYFESKGLEQKTTAAFMKYMYSGMMLKLFVCLIAVLSYVFATRPDYSRTAILICMLLYVVYTAVEIITLTKINKEKR